MYVIEPPASAGSGFAEASLVRLRTGAEWTVVSSLSVAGFVWSEAIVAMSCKTVPFTTLFGMCTFTVIVPLEFPGSPLAVHTHLWFVVSFVNVNETGPLSLWLTRVASAVPEGFKGRFSKFV